MDILTPILGISVLISYYITFRDEKQNYMNSRFWLGLSKNNILALVVFQLLALIGAVIFFTWINGYWGKPPSNGLLVYNNGNVAKCLIWSFLLASMFWSFLAKKSLVTNELIWVCLTVLVLCIAGISVIGLLAGAFENQDTPTLAFIGIIELASVVVLADAIGWNSLFISNFLYS